MKQQGDEATSRNFVCASKRGQRNPSFQPHDPYVKVLPLGRLEDFGQVAVRPDQLDYRGPKFLSPETRWGGETWEQYVNTVVVVDDVDKPRKKDAGMRTGWGNPEIKN